MKKMLLTCLATCALYSQISAYSNHTDLRREFSRQNTWALHTSIDLGDCRHRDITHLATLESFTYNLCTQLGVTPVGIPQSIYNYAGNGYTSGYSLHQLANGHTSISVHVDESQSRIFINIFSCKYYDAYSIIDYAQRFFDAYDVTTDITFRR